MRKQREREKRGRLREDGKVEKSEGKRKQKRRYITRRWKGRERQQEQISEEGKRRELGSLEKERRKKMTEKGRKGEKC